MNKRFRSILLTVLVSLVVFLAWQYPWQKPPVQEITLARQYLAEANMIHADKYSPAIFAKANLHYDSAMIEWNIENEKWSVFSNYEKVKAYAQTAHQLAREAIDQTERNYANTADILNARISRVENKITSFQHNYGNFPFHGADRKELVSSKLMLKESKLAWQQSNFQLCKHKLDAAETIINALYERYEALVKIYFEQHDTWEKDIQSTLAYSKKYKTYCIIIDKYARECTLYKNGQRQQTFACELGPNWMGDKNHQGDKSTPEGRYTIMSKKSNGSTVYYKAFLLDYPNEEDKERFATNQKNGILKKDANIGNLIEIHGNGGKDMDWTNGCVALKNEDMDILYDVCPEGTNVTIVGSAKPLQNLEMYSHE